MKTIKTRQARVPIPLYNEISRYQKKLQREENNKYGKKKRNITWSLAAKIWHRDFKSGSAYMGGGLL